MAAAPVEFCQFVVLRSPRGRLGSVQDVGKRLRRMRAGFHRWIPMRTGAQLPRGLHHDPPKFSIQSSLESPKHRRMRRRRLPMSSTDPERHPRDLGTTNRQDSTDAPAMVASSISRIKKIIFFGPQYVSH